MTTGEHAAALSLRWQRAALLGSLWAANEIVLGSFLHNVGVPFAGTVLATMAVALLVAGSRLWRDAGVLWRAGLVCALMKSISPSAVILGPMIGITLEAVIVAGAAGLSRHTAAGAIVGGMLATTAPMLQKIAALVFTYGTDVARMYASLFTFLTGALDITGPDPGRALLWFIALQAVPGAAAAIAGIIIARGVHAARQEPLVWTAAPGPEPDLLHSTTQNFSTGQLALHALVLIAGLLTLPMLPPLLTPIPAALYLGAVLVRYPGLRAKFKRVRLWLELTAIALLAGVLLGVFSPGGTGTWWTGLQSGVVMTARAVVVICGFGAISIELRNPLILDWFFRRGLGTVSAAMRIAFQALPSMVQGLSSGPVALRHPLRSTSRMLAFILQRLEEMNASARRPAVFIVTGAQGSGKTTALSRIVDSLREQHIGVHGFLSHVIAPNGRREGYDIEILRTGERLPLCRTNAAGRDDRIGPFSFTTEGVYAGRRSMETAGADGSGVCFVDEIGPLEFQGKGWAPTLPLLLKESSGTIVLVVRPDLVRDVQKHFGVMAQSVWDAGELRKGADTAFLSALQRSVAGL